MTASQIAEAAATADPDWESRALCSDENCIGLLNADGLCRVCGKPGTPGDAAIAKARVDRSDDDADDDRDHVDDDHADAAHDAAASADADDDQDVDSLADRELCPDENCIGVLNDRGACKVCGKTKSP